MLDDLLASARAGDAPALATLLSHYEGSMRAVAVRLLGYGPDAEDAVQDAVVTAFTRLGDLQDPSAFEAWIRAIVRNNCLTHLRQRGRLSDAEFDPDSLRSRLDDPEGALDQIVMRDWVWQSVSQLSEPLRTVTLLRHFSAARSYEAIATVCGIPVGTVRSRLSQARVKLSGHLREAENSQFADATAAREGARDRAQWFLTSVEHGDLRTAVNDVWHDDIRAVGPQGEDWLDHSTLFAELRTDADHGLVHTLTDVYAAGNVQIWETEMRTPDPEYCIHPRVLWLQHFDEHRVAHLRLYHPEPDSRAA